MSTETTPLKGDQITELLAGIQSSPVVALTSVVYDGRATCDTAVLENGRRFAAYDGEPWGEMLPVPGTIAAHIVARTLADPIDIKYRQTRSALEGAALNLGDADRLGLNKAECAIRLEKAAAEYHAARTAQRERNETE